MPLLWILYPVLVHSAVISGSSYLEMAAISLLLILSLQLPLRNKRGWAWGLAVGGVAGSVWFCSSGLGIYFLYLPPVLINGFLAAVFAQSLQSGRRAMISIVAEKIRREPLPEPLEQYTRRLTVFWAGLFFTMALLSINLAVFASNQSWSLFTNFISYGVVGSVFIVEFLLRRRWFPQFHHKGLIAYLRGVIQSDFRSL